MECLLFEFGKTHYKPLVNSNRSAYCFSSVWSMVTIKNLLWKEKHVADDNTGRFDVMGYILSVFKSWQDQIVTCLYMYLVQAYKMAKSVVRYKKANTLNFAY